MRITDRQLTCLRLAARGYAMNETAKKIYVSERTVKNYLSEVRKTLGARNTAHAVAIAMASGLLVAEASREVSVDVALARIAGALGYDVVLSRGAG